jgi:hypothetical protein
MHAVSTEQNGNINQNVQESHDFRQISRKFLGCAGKKHLGEKGQKATGNSSEEKLLHAANHSKAESKVEAKLYDSAINRTTTAATLS